MNFTVHHIRLPPWKYPFSLTCSTKYYKSRKCIFNLCPSLLFDPFDYLLLYVCLSFQLFGGCHKQLNVVIAAWCFQLMTKGFIVYSFFVLITVHSFRFYWTKNKKTIKHPPHKWGCRAVRQHQINWILFFVFITLG